MFHNKKAIIVILLRYSDHRSVRLFDALQVPTLVPACPSKDLELQLCNAHCAHIANQYFHIILQHVISTNCCDDQTPTFRI